MFFVVDKPQLQRMIAITRDDRLPGQQGADGPFFRMEARDGRLRLTGREVEATFPATVYEPGVLFLRVTLFRRMLRTMAGVKTLAIQVAADGLHFGDVKFGWNAGDMLLYPDPTQAPQRHPAEAMPDDPSAEGQGTLFPDPD